MMIKVYFIKNEEQWSNDRLDQMLLPLPNDLRSKILIYKNWKERQSRILGKHLLLKLIDHFKLNLTLADLRYTAFNKPYFEPLKVFGIFDFSIAHSGDIVVCAGTMTAQLGIDIEHIQPIDLENYQEQLSANEWKFIHDSPDPQKAFYEIWTKKEALLKALGRGIDIDFDTLDVSRKATEYDGRKYYFCPLLFAADHIVHIAASAPFDSAAISSERYYLPVRQ